MSRAFVKEDSDAPPPAPFERLISAAPNLVTARGARLIEEELARLEAQLAGGQVEADSLAMIQRDLRYWTTRRASAQLVARSAEPGTVGFGTRVTLRRSGVVSRIAIVGEDEADPTTGRIAWTSPLARALEGAEPGEMVELDAGGRVEFIELIHVDGMID